MFTGIIEEVGRVLSLQERGGKRRLTIGAAQVTRELKKGQSVAVSGVCLTAVEVGRDRFGADLAAETVARTSFSRLQPGALVNLELPTRAGERMGGHIVQGHVDGVGKLAALEQVPGGQDYWLKVQAPQELARYIAFKGSIAIEGISLTVAGVEGAQVNVAIIPHTYEVTNLKSLAPGDPLNIETDIIAKYTERMLSEAAPTALTLEQMIREGF